MTDDIIKRLREAIAAGPTLGPWSVNGTTVFLADRAAIDLYRCPSARSNAQYIAAASPDNITALLDEIESLEAEVIECGNEIVASANDVQRLRAENEALRNAIGDVRRIAREEAASIVFSQARP